MARFLIFGKQTDERYGLALMLEFAGHQCAIASTLEEAVELVQREDCQLVLGDSPQDSRSLGESVRTLRSVAPKVPVMFLTEEIDPRLKPDEVVSGLQPAGGSFGAPISVLSLGEAFSVLLPKPDAFRRLAELPKTPAVLNRLAALYQAQKVYEVAEQLYKQALQLAEQTNRAPGEVATLLNNLASLYHEQGDYDAAESHYLKSLAMVEKTFGPNHEKVIRRLHNLANLYQAQGKEEESAHLLARLKHAGRRA